MSFLRFNSYEGLSLTLDVLLFLFFESLHYFFALKYAAHLREFQVTELPI